MVFQVLQAPSRPQGAPHKGLQLCAKEQGRRQSGEGHQEGQDAEDPQGCGQGGAQWSAAEEFL